MVREMKHTEIGDIPVDWKLQTFEETFRVLSNNTLPRANLNNRGGLVRNVHYGDILTQYTEVLNCKKDDIPYINDISLLSSSAQLLQDGDIIISDTAEDDTVGKATEVYGLGDSRMVAGLHTIPCRVKKGDFAPGWLGYYMNSYMYHDQIIPFITGIKVSSISKSALAETLIVIPPRNEQVDIVETLLEIDNLITGIKRTIEKLYDFKQSLLQAMFPKIDRTEPEVRIPGFTGAWEQRKLSNLCEVITVGIANSATHAYTDDGIVMFRNQNIKENYLDDSDVIYIDEDFEKKYSSKRLKANDLLVARTGYPGTACVVPEKYEGSQTFTTLIARLKEGTNPFYACQYINSDYGKKYFSATQIGGGQKNSGARILEDFPMILPPTVAEQNKIVDCFSNFDNLITLHQCKLEKYENIKQGMMSELLTGKIRLV